MDTEEVPAEEEGVGGDGGDDVSWDAFPGFNDSGFVQGGMVDFDSLENELGDLAQNLAAAAAPVEAGPAAGPAAAPATAPDEIFSHALTVEEGGQVTKILNLIGHDVASSVMCRSIPKPEWVDFEGNPPTEKAHAYEPTNTKSNYNIQCTALKTFMMGGYWHDMGCPDLKNFFSWFASHVSTRERQIAFKKRLGKIHNYSPRRFPGTMYPILVRIFFNYASAFENMDQLNAAFHAHL